MDKEVIDFVVYHPRIVDMVLKYDIPTLVAARGKGKMKKGKPRRYHRKDCTQFISPSMEGEFSTLFAWSSGVMGKGFVTSPIYVEPFKQDSAILAAVIKVLMKQFQISEETFGIVGRLNSSPVWKYRKLEEKMKEVSCPSLDCKFQQTKIKDCLCHCVWQPNQLLTWGRMEGEKFVPLSKPIRSTKLDMFQLAEEVKKEVPEVWKIFVDHPGKKYQELLSVETIGTANEGKEFIGTLRLIDSIYTIQRTDMSTTNCYGLPLHQFHMAVETSYADNDRIVYVNLAIGIRDPENENLSQARKRLGIKIKRPRKKQDSSGGVKYKNGIVLPVIPLPHLDNPVIPLSDDKVKTEKEEVVEKEEEEVVEKEEFVDEEEIVDEENNDLDSIELTIDDDEDNY